MDKKQILSNIKKLSENHDKQIKKPFNVKSIFYIIIALACSTIISLSIIFLLIYL